MVSLETIVGREVCAGELSGENMKFKTWQADVAVDAFYSHVQPTVRILSQTKMFHCKDLMLVARMPSLAAVIY